MKIFAPEQKKVVRVEAKGGKQGNKTITLEETHLNEVFDMIDKIFSNIKVTISIKANEKPQGVTLLCQEVVSGTKGRSKSQTVYGLSPKEIIEEIVRVVELNK